LLEVVAVISITRVLHLAENYCDGLLVLTDAEERLVFPLPVGWGYLVMLPRALQLYFDLMVLPAEDFREGVGYFSGVARQHLDLRLRFCTPVIVGQLLVVLS
jgi:hypothetical protein